MSEFAVHVFNLDNFGKAPNSDRLSIVNVNGVPVLFTTELFTPGQLVAHIPHDSMVPVDHPEFKFLDEGKGVKLARVRAKKIRGVTSYGFLIPAPDGCKPGDDAAARLGVVKYEEPVPLTNGGETERDPGYAPKYTDIQNFQKYNPLLIPGEEIVVTEKIHGANSMYLFKNNRLYVRSHKEYKKDELPCTQCQTPALPGVERCQNMLCGAIRPMSIYWRVVPLYGLDTKLKKLENIAIFGEVYGQVQDLKYGAQKGQLFFRAFDAYDTTLGRYLDHDDAKARIISVGIDWVPELYRGPYERTKIEELAKGNSSLADNVKEGVVIKPVKERFDEAIKGRVIMKLVGEQYHLRRGGTEHH